LSFNNLPPGKYTLQVKGSNKITGKFTETDTLVFSIQPGPFQTIWFRILLGSIMILAGFLFYKWRINSVKKQAGLKQKISETEMMALRAQMSPHFIFNCLNSIDNLIQNNEKEKATTYLAKFAKLIRAILENSKSNTIPCWKDMETLRLYLELEEFRWDKKFNYSLSIAPAILQGDYKVPPLVIQPYVENAIHHGLLNKEEMEKHLSVTVEAKNNCICYTVEDNGIGRKKAMEYKALNKPSHQSMGLDITLDRINLFNQNNNGSVVFTDLYDEHDQPAGTRVQITLNNLS
jgi:LytS/YehU family sensor histidine kinase